MAQESCNLDKDEAEILKATSSSSSSSSSTPPPAAAASSPPPPPPPPPSPPSLFTKPSQEFPPQRTEELETQTTNSLAEDSSAPKPAEESSLASQYVNRCFSCQKRVGLTGFRCRCGHLFCPRHRYSDTHDCSFDYKAAGRAEISKNNPLIRAAKIIKI